MGMSDFSIKEALLAGPRMARRKPAMIVAWVLLFLLLAAGSAWVIQLRDNSIRADLLAGRSRGQAMTGPLLVLFVEGLLFLAVRTVILASSFRALLNRSEGGAAGLRLGLPEVKLFAVSFIVQILSILPQLASPLLYQTGSRELIAWTLPNSPVMLLISWCGALWVMVAAIVAFEQGRIAPFRCWATTRGHFWKLAALFLAATVLMVALGLLPGEIAAMIGLQSTGEAHPWRIAQVLLAGHSLFGGLTTTAGLLMGVYNAIISAASVAILSGIVVVAYQARPQKA